MSAPRVPLTECAHWYAASALFPGAIALDATAGNGHDTLFLAAHVGPTGRVFAFDVQAAALEATTARLQAADHGEPLVDRVQLFQVDHSRFPEHLPARTQGEVAVVMFNLGYLPGGDKSQTTRGATTVIALRHAVDWLRPGGLITVLAYPGHDAGVELTLLLSFLAALPEHLAWTEHEVATASSRSPRLFVLRKHDGERSPTGTRALA
ncbi:MAG: class I SAM-dependent methyltransferase [Planctomycetaceae bacterium]|nr:class I SAM-dependent methyltransferase [Planctomycetaceae bacterium]